MTYADLSLRLPSTSERWHGDGFREELTAWVTSVLGEEVSSVEPLRVRPWATVWRVVSPGGVHFAKQNCPPQSHEAALLAELGTIAPAHVVPVTAIDQDRGLLLTRDQGEPLGRATPDDRAGLDTWCRVVASGAALQREVAPYAARLVAAGLEPLLPGEIVSYVEQRLEDFATLPVDDPRAADPERLRALRAKLPEIAGWVDEVVALGLPATLNHNDLHGDNVFDGSEGLRFFDFGDALLMEPLAALRVPVNILVHGWETSPDDPRVRRVEDAALEVWSDLAPVAELRRALPAALRLARLGRAESWIRCLASMTATELEEYGDTAGYWTTSVLDP